MLPPDNRASMHGCGSQRKFISQGRRRIVQAAAAIPSDMRVSGKSVRLLAPEPPKPGQTQPRLLGLVAIFFYTVQITQSIAITREINWENGRVTAWQLICASLSSAKPAPP